MFIRFEERRTRKRERSDYVGACKRRLKPIEELRPRRVAICRCDQCRNEFETKNHPTLQQTRGIHFCSATCRKLAQKKGGFIFDKQKAVMLEKYGVENCLVRPDVLSKLVVSSHSADAERKRSSSLKKYHENRPQSWTNPGNTPSAAKKRHETMKLNGTYARSKIEDRCFDFLCEKFGIENIQRHVKINEKWPIDFYIESIKTYVQIDGVYWHGLDRPIDEIRASVTKRDKQISKHWETDRAQNTWFASNGLRLVRITDVEFKRSQQLLLERLR